MTESLATKIDPALLTASKDTGTSEVCMDVQNLNLFYGESQALNDISFEIEKKSRHSFHWPQWLRKIDSAALL